MMCSVMPDYLRRTTARLEYCGAVIIDSRVSCHQFTALMVRFLQLIDPPCFLSNVAVCSMHVLVKSETTCVVLFEEDVSFPQSPSRQR